MPFDQKPNTGALFNNERKDSPTHPDKTGNGLIECPHCGKTAEYWMNGWIKEGKRGKFMSIAFKSKIEKRDPRPAREALDDEIPW